MAAVGLAVLLAGAAGGAVAGGAGGAVTTHSTPAGKALARHALLNRSDLGRRWTSMPAPRTVPGLTCPAFSPTLSGVVQTGAAISPTFQAGATGPFASQTAYAYANGSEEATVWRELARPHLLTCVAASLVRSASSGVHFKVNGKHLFTLPSLAVNAMGYRVTGTATVPNQTVDVYLDVLLLGGGTTVTELSFSSFVEPMARAVELRLARIVAGRLATE
ncbi:MAG: hypothetical protein ACRDPA_20190 [Solirubrobacteraceae bacterium]